MTHLIYVVRGKVDTDPMLPQQAEGKPHSEKHGFLESDMIHLSSHNHPWYR